MSTPSGVVRRAAPADGCSRFAVLKRPVKNFCQAFVRLVGRIASVLSCVRASYTVLADGVEQSESQVRMAVGRRSVASASRQAMSSGAAASLQGPGVGCERAVWRRALLDRYARMSPAEQRAEAERSRGGLVKLWREVALPEKKGRTFRALLPVECMREIPHLLEASLSL